MKTVGIIGLGSIGLRHAKNLIEMGHQVIGYDPNDAAMQHFKDLGGDAYAVLEEFYHSVPEMDAVVIASPTSLHAHHLLTTPPLMATFVEKPVGANWGDYEFLRAQLHSMRPITVGNNLRFHGCVQKAKRFLLEIGEPLWANFTVAQYNARPQYLRDGVTLNWGAHEMDLALYLLGPAEVVGASINKEDTVSQILLMHESGCRTVLHFDYLTKNEVRTFLIQGQDRLIACNLRLGVIGTDDGNTYFWDDKDFDETYVLEMKAFLDGDTSIAATGEDGLRCLKLLLDAKKMGGL